MTRVSFAEVVENPTRVFNSPQEVLAEPHLSIEKKLELLKSWEVDAHQLQTATDENMTGGEPSRLAEVRAAIDQLERMLRGE